MNGCEQVEAVVIEEEAAIDISYQTLDILCSGDNSGVIDVEVAGGVAPYAFEWNTGATVDSIGELVAGTYELSITDSNDCIFNSAFTITEPAPLELTAEVEPLSCFDQLDGSIQIDITGGAGDYEILWSNGATSDEIEDLGSGTYGVTITDGNNCTLSTAYTLDQPTELVSSLTSVDVNCFGENTGQIDLEVEGGVAPYEFNWSNGSNEIDPGDLEAGQYTVTISDDSGCTAVQMATIDEPELLNSIPQVNNNLCYGDNEGSIVLNTTGGVSPYTYEWNTGATTDNLDGLTAGTYEVVITDDNGCVYNNAITITEPAPIEVASEVETISCFDELDGSIQIDISGGAGDYEILWSNGATSDEIEDLGSGTYGVTITDGNNCTLSTTYTLDQPTELVSTLTSVDVNCFGENTGQIDLEVEGGLAPYEFNWSNGANEIDPGDLEAGQYSVTISDDNGCTAVQTATIDEPEILSNTSQVFNNFCYGDNLGSIVLNPAGGVSPYTYEWNTGAEESEINNLPAGSYSYTITDANDCVLANSITITESAPIEVVAQNQNVDCYNNASGAIDLNVSGGGGSYSYEWSNGATTSSVSDLEEGEYWVTITDIYDCSVVESISIEQPEVLTVLSSVNMVTCYGLSDASITLESSGGVAPYVYAWENGMQGSSLDGLEAGEYIVTVTDTNNCQEIQTFTITEPPLLEANFLVDAPLCNGDLTGAISSTVLGGIAPYNYEWSNGSDQAAIDGLEAGTYSLTVTDVNGCILTEDVVVTEPYPLGMEWLTTPVVCHGDATGSIDLFLWGGTADYSVFWSNGETTQNLDSLEAGVYGAIIIDANGCSINLSEVEITQNDSMTVVAEQIEPLSCDGLYEGVITASTIGGVGGYNYSWSNGVDSSTIITTAPGEYILTVTDSEGCTTVASFEALQEEGLTIENSINNVSCFGAFDAEVNIIVTGGSDDYSYLWSTGDTTVSISQLGPGTYFVDVVDSEGCFAADTFEVTEPAVLEVLETSVDPTPGNDDGSISVTASGGVAPYTISWDNGASDFDLNDLAAGTYVYTVTDANDCIHSDSVTLELIIGVNSPIAQQVSIYPNPSMGEINIESSINEMDLVVYDLLGRVVYQNRKPDNVAVWTLSLDHVAAGVYYFKVRTAEGDLLKKVVLKQYCYKIRRGVLFCKTPLLKNNLTYTVSVISFD